MALQAPLSQLPALPALCPDAWSSLSGHLSNPLKTLRRYRLSTTASLENPFEQSREISHSTRGVVVGQDNEVQQQATNSAQPQHAAQLQLPDCLCTVSTSALRAHPNMSSPSLTPLSFASRSAFQQTAPKGTIMILRRALSTSGPRSSCPAPTTATARIFRSPRSTFPTFVPGPPRRGRANLMDQKRAFSSTFQRQNHNALAHAERAANNNPTSATAQQAFYSGLIRANMPKIVIERYQTGRYATNAAADASYLKALQLTGSVPAPGAVGGEMAGTSGLTAQQLQSVGQAIAGQSIGSGSVVRPGANTGTGAKDTPLYVVVEESWASTAFRWVKLFLWAGIVGYFLIVCFSMLAEMGSSFRTRVAQNNEVQPQHQTVRFSDVHGCDEAKEELQELVEFLLNPDRFNQLGGKLPKGILLVGPPGTGKTMLARAVAGEAGCPVFYMSGSEFDELYVGVGAKRVRDLFAQARNKAPAIIFIDELDAVGGKRNARDPAYAKQTLNQLLTELDGFSPSTGVILIAATNYPESLDKALTRPGRFDRHVNVPLPDVRGRIEILKHHMKNVPVAGDVDATNLARATSGMSGADLENLVNQAAVHASRMKYKKVNASNFEWAKDKILMGAETKSRLIREKDKVMTAYHEAGHALVNLFTPASDQLYKMTIIPRGRALGVTHFLPEMDAVSMGYDQFLAHIDVCMGGRAAEEYIYGPDKVSSGIAHDVKSATSTAYHLVTQCGYSKKLGNVDLASSYDKLSSETKQEIEREVREIVEAARARADKIISEKRKELELLKDALMEYETLDKEEILKVMKGEKLKKIEPEKRPSDERDDQGGRTAKQPEKKSPHPSPSKGGVGIKLPDVLLPPAVGNKGGEAPRVQDEANR